MARGQNANGVRHFNQGQYGAALHEFQQALLNDQRNEDALYNQARTYHQLAKQTNDPNALRQAEQLYNACLDENDNHVDCRRALAVLLAESGRTDKAFVQLGNWAERNPALADPRIELARLHQEQGNREQAKIYLSQALAINYNDPRVLSALGQIHEQEGNYLQALANYDRVYRQNGQPELGQRVAALQRQLAVSGATVTPQGGTRTVAVPAARY